LVLEELIESSVMNSPAERRTRLLYMEGRQIAGPSVVDQAMT